MERVDGAYIIGVTGGSARKRVTGEELEMAKAATTYVTHEDGTRSQRKSATMSYTHAVEVREDMWVAAKQHQAEADKRNAEVARFIAAVKVGRVRTEASGSVYVLGEGDEKFWIGHHSEAEPLDRKSGVRDWLKRYKERAATKESEAREAESGPQYRYGVIRWSQSRENANKGLLEFERRYAGIPGHKFRVMPVDADA
jgi:hypothetical protein